MRGVLKICGDEHVIELPRTIIDLYSLKEGTDFEIKAIVVKDKLLINVSTSLLD